MKIKSVTKMEIEKLEFLKKHIFQCTETSIVVKEEDVDKVGSTTLLSNNLLYKQGTIPNTIIITTRKDEPITPDVIKVILNVDISELDLEDLKRSLNEGETEKTSPFTIKDGVLDLSNYPELSENIRKAIYEKGKGNRHYKFNEDCDLLDFLKDSKYLYNMNLA